MATVKSGPVLPQCENRSKGVGRRFQRRRFRGVLSLPLAIDHALLPEIWCIVKEYIHVHELCMLRELSMDVTRGFTRPKELDVTLVVQDGLLNVLKWMCRETAPPSPVAKSYYETGQLAMVKVCSTKGVVREREFGSYVHPVNCRFDVGNQHIALNIINTAMYCNHLKILRWLHSVTLINKYAPSLSMSWIVEYMDLDALKWAFAIGLPMYCNMDHTVTKLGKLDQLYWWKSMIKNRSTITPHNRCPYYVSDEHYIKQNNNEVERWISSGRY